MTGAIWRRRRAGGMAVATALVAATSWGQIAMPAPSEMSGIPLPAGDLPNGSVSVRLIREQLSNNLIDHPVELRVAGDIRTVATDENGRALFEGIPSSRVSVSATVDDEVLGSQEFTVPVRGGVRVMLVAGVTAEAGVATSAAGSVAEAVPGIVTFGGDTRWVVEMSDEAVEVYYLLEVANAGTSPVTPPEPVALDLPAAAQGAVLLEGTSAQVRLDGHRVSVEGPLPPGRTPINVAYVLPYSGPDLTIDQRVPVSIEQVAIVAEKRGDMQLLSPQITQEREMNAAAGTFLVGGGPGLDAGATLSIELTGLPHHSATPRLTAMTLVGLIVVWGGFAMQDRPRETMGRRQRQNLQARRERLFGDLVRIEMAHRSGAMGDAPFAKRREELIAQLERVYHRLEPTTPVPSGAGLRG